MDQTSVDGLKANPGADGFTFSMRAESCANLVRLDLAVARKNDRL